MKVAPKLATMTSNLVAAGTFLTLGSIFAAPALAGETLLTVVNAEGEVSEYDLEALDGFKQIEFETSSLWTTNETDFSGPALEDVLQDAGITEGMINLVAANYYEIEIDLDDSAITEDYPIIATRRDGGTYDLPDNGPLWIMFPFDDKPTLKEERVYSFSIWQLMKITQNED